MKASTPQSTNRNANHVYAEGLTSPKMISEVLETLRPELKSTFRSINSNSWCCIQRWMSHLPDSSLLQQPCQCTTNVQKPSTGYVPSRNSYKVYGNFCESLKNATFFSAILETGASSSWICVSDLPSSLKSFIKMLDSYLTILNAN